MANRRYIRSRLPSLRGRTAFVRIARRVQHEYRIYGSWKRVGAFYGVSGASARHVAMGREPHAAHLRQAFGLPIIVSIAACPKCGKLHDQLKVCPDKRKRRILNDLPIAERPPALLAWQIRNRTEML